MKTLILFAHPSYHKSTVNKVLLTDLDKNEELTIHDLYQEYPDFDIDIDREQEAKLKCCISVMLTFI